MKTNDKKLLINIFFIGFSLVCICALAYFASTMYQMNNTDRNVFILIGIIDLTLFVLGVYGVSEYFRYKTKVKGSVQLINGSMGDLNER